MNNVTVSVIIPVFNSELFLEKCLESVVNQTLSNIEIIIVNDGSTDNSQKIIQKYQEQNDNIITIEHCNQGLAVSRNKALDIARGEYVAFVDSDDYIEVEMLEVMYKEAKQSEVDIVMCNWDKVDPEGRVLSKQNHEKYHNKIFSRDEIIKEFFLNKKELVEGYSWNKLFRRNLLEENQLRYPHMKYEDMPFTLDVLTKIKKCKFINHTFYHYVQHDASIVHTLSEENITFFIEAVKMLEDVLKKENLNVLDFSHEYYVYSTNQYLSEYYASRQMIQSSKTLSQLFNERLQLVSLRKCFSMHKYIDVKLVAKILLYKLGLLDVLMDIKKRKPVLSMK